MRVSARRRKGYAHSLTARHHTLVSGDAELDGGADVGPTPQELLALSLASCTAITIEMYGDRKGWELGELAVDVDYEPGKDGGPARFEVAIKVPVPLSEDQSERLRAIAGRCPVHRALIGEVAIDDRIETG